MSSNWNFERVFLNVPPSLLWTPDQFFEFCVSNQDLGIERPAAGSLVIQPPVGAYTSIQSASISTQLGNWAEADKSGVAFGACTGFALSSGAVYGPSAAWVLRSRLATLTAEQKTKFLPLCPEFVLELRSPSNSLPPLRDKMQNYVDNGARLGFLIDPQTRQVTLYRPGAELHTLNAPESVSGDPELPGFTLNLARIWNPGF